jgi:hypothetical protein
MVRGFRSYIAILLMITVLLIPSVVIVKAQDEKDIKINEFETKLRLYDEAINELQAPSAEETALVYAKGVQKRNGVMQYSVMSNSLKEVFKKEMWNEYWVTGVSSPWVSSYKIVSKKGVVIAHKITIEFSWATSSGPACITQEELTIAKEDGKWRIVRIKAVE